MLRVYCLDDGRRKEVAGFSVEEGRRDDREGLGMGIGYDGFGF